MQNLMQGGDLLSNAPNLAQELKTGLSKIYVKI